MLLFADQHDREDRRSQHHQKDDGQDQAAAEEGAGGIGAAVSGGSLRLGQLHARRIDRRIGRSCRGIGSAAVEDHEDGGRRLLLQQLRDQAAGKLQIAVFRGVEQVEVEVVVGRDPADALR